MNFSLNRFGITGNIDYNTPLCVLEEIIKCLGDEITLEDIGEHKSQVIEYIQEFSKDIEIKDSYTEEELCLISTFVSQEETSWDQNNLLKAFNHLVSYNNNIPERFVYGPKTNNNPLSYDVTMMYAYCSENGIRTNYNDTLNELAAYVRLSFANKHILLDTLITKLSLMDTFGLINVLKETKYCNNEDFVFSDSSKESIVKLKNSDKIRTILTNEEAIIQSAKNYNIDISSSSTPSREFIEMSKGSNFKPITDNAFQSNYKLNPLYYDMTKYWKSDLSCLYDEKSLMKLLSSECVNHNEISDPRHFLYEITLTKNIYPGIIPEAKYTETFIYKTPFEEINTKHIISYGILHTKDLIALTPEEITKFLRIHKEFKDFINHGEILSERILKKLILICKSFPHEQKYNELLDIIRDTKTLGNVMNSKMKEFISYVKNCENATKEQINLMFDNMFKLAMYMRGWKEDKDYPLSASQCNKYAENFDEIETRVALSIKNLVEAINAMPDSMKMIIKSLPLIKFEEKDKNYYRNTNTDEGITFYERLVFISTKPDSMYSCLRLSSNFIASTSQYYNVLLNGKSYIDISKLEFIQ